VVFLSGRPKLSARLCAMAPDSLFMENGWFVAETIHYTVEAK
jgi:hypothetical protein